MRMDDVTDYYKLLPKDVETNPTLKRANELVDELISLHQEFDEEKEECLRLLGEQSQFQNEAAQDKTVAELHAHRCWEAISLGELMRVVPREINRAVRDRMVREMRAWREKHGKPMKVGTSAATGFTRRIK
jgi:hypothetical protein